jgi:hypothetical protein
MKTQRWMSRVTSLSLAIGQNITRTSFFEASLYADDMSSFLLKLSKYSLININIYSKKILNTKNYDRGVLPNLSSRSSL